MLKIMRAKTSKMMGRIVSWITVCGCDRFVRDFACTYVRTCPRPHLILRFGDGFQNYAQNHAFFDVQNHKKRRHGAQGGASHAPPGATRRLCPLLLGPRGGFARSSWGHEEALPAPPGAW